MTVRDAQTECHAVVLKFGSSVLPGPEAIDRVVSEIYRYVRIGVKVIAVVSALDGETDHLYAEIDKLGGRSKSRHTPRLVMIGEERTAALLAIACDQSGLDARIVGAREISLTAAGDIDDAHPKAIDNALLRSAATKHDVIIVPGFVAIGDTGEPVLLGRGGSDLTAVFLADALGLERVTLLKDVAGVYEQDPAQSAGLIKKFDFISWDDARGVAGALLQPKAISWAKERNIEIAVMRLNASSGTIVGGRNAAPKVAVCDGPLRVGVAGLGVVGEGVVLRLLKDPATYRLGGVLVSDLRKARHEAISPSLIKDDIDDFLDGQYDVIIDALSCGKTGRQLTDAALTSGVDIVSANKQSIAGVLDRLHGAATKNNAALLYSASVGGGVPMVETVRTARRSGDVQEINAIVNGTVNYILSKMGQGMDFEAAVTAAQEAGFAESDPSADLSGNDAKAKSSILCFEAWGHEPDEGAFAISGLTRKMAETFVRTGGVWRQITKINRTVTNVTRICVNFEDVSGHSLFSTCNEEENAAVVTLTTGEQFLCKGRGAGRIPTVESLLADLGVLVRQRQNHVERPKVHKER